MSAISFAEARSSLRVIGLLAGLGLLVPAAWALHDPLASMARYTGGLMALNQAAPALIVSAIPAANWRRLAAWPAARHWLLDPWIAASASVLISTAISFPAILETSLANALFAAPLGLVEFLCGLLVWSQLAAGPVGLDRGWKRGLFALAVGIPMTVVSVVWMLSPTVLYTPYLDVICLWNLTPLQDQRWSGFVMLVSGLPLQLVGVWMLTIGD